MVAILSTDGHLDVAVSNILSGIHEYWEALCKRYDDSTEAAAAQRKRADAETTAQTTAKTTSRAVGRTTAVITVKTTTTIHGTTSTSSTTSASKTTASTSSNTDSSTGSSTGSTTMPAPTASGTWVPSYSAVGGETVSAYVNSAGKVVSIAYVGTDGRMTIMPYTADAGTAAATTVPATTTTTDASTSASASSTTSAAASSASSSSSKSSQAGVVIGIVVSLMAVFLLILVCFRYRRSRLMRPLFKNLDDQSPPTGRGSATRGSSRDSLLDPIPTATSEMDGDAEKQEFERHTAVQPRVIKTEAFVAADRAVGAVAGRCLTPASRRNSQPLAGRPDSSVLPQQHVAPAAAAPWPMPARAPSSLDSYSTFPSVQNKCSSGGNGRTTPVSRQQTSPAPTPQSARPPRRSPGPPQIVHVTSQSTYPPSSAQNSGFWNQKRVPLSPLPASPTSSLAPHLSPSLGRRSRDDQADHDSGRCTSFVSLGGISIASSAVASPSRLPWPMPPSSVSDTSCAGGRSDNTVSRSTAAHTNFTMATAAAESTAAPGIPRKPLAPSAQVPTRAALDGPGSRDLLQAAKRRRSSVLLGLEGATSPPPMEAPPPPPGMAPPRGSGLILQRDSSSIMVRVPISRFYSSRGGAADGQS